MRHRWLGIVLTVLIFPAVFAEGSKLQLRSGAGELERLEADLPDQLRLEATSSTPYMLVRWHDDVNYPEVQAELERLGGVAFGKVGPRTLVARLDPTKRDALRSRSSIFDLSFYQPGYKIDRALIGFDGLRVLSLLAWPDESESGLDASLQKLGVNVLHRYRGQRVIEADWPLVENILKLDALRVVSDHTPMRPQGGEINGSLQVGERTDSSPYTGAGIDGGGISGASNCTVSGLVCAEASDCSGVEDVCPTAAQTLLSIDTGIQLDAADLSDSDSSAGVAGLAHRKVRRYQSATAYGGAGDLLGCDIATSGGLTHGHAVAAYALGNATNVPPGYGAGQRYLDDSGTLRSLDGVAPAALLVAVDAQETPSIGPCPSAATALVTPGDLYDGVGSGALEATYLADGARTSLLAWGGGNGNYTPEAIDVDEFMASYPDALVVAATGSQDALSPATAKNVLSVGVGGVGVAPAPQGRVPMQLYVPEVTTSDVVCASGDIDQNAPVECFATGLSGTSVSSALVSGAALLVRDYFAKGFYPDGRDSNFSNGSDRVPNLSGALSRALLIASASYPDQVPEDARFNGRFGYGAPNLSNVLPLDAEASSVTALMIVDGAISGGASDLPGLVGQIDATAMTQQSATVEVCDSSQELRVALAWVDELDGGLTGALVNNLDLELISPTGLIFRGNYFTDDDDGDGSLDLLSEECPSVHGASNTLDAAAWSLPSCLRADASPSPRDDLHTTEAIYLSPDYFGDNAVDLNPADDNQIELGSWTVRVSTDGTGTALNQGYAIVVAGGLCSGSSVRALASSYRCNGEFSATIFDFNEPGDLGVDIAEVTGRSHVEVLDGGLVVDCEGAGCVGPSLPPVVQPDPAEMSFQIQPLTLSSQTARDPGNGVLDVRDGDTVRVVYTDELNGVPEPDLRREGEARIDCQVDLSHGEVLLQQWGLDRSTRLSGGCERSVRGMFEYGFPDRYIDAGERVVLQFAIASEESVTLPALEASLRCVEIDDIQAPEYCLPGSDDCADPNRLANTSCPASYLTILNPIQQLGDVTSFSALAISFDIAVGAEGAIPPEHEVEFVLDLTAPVAGFTRPLTIVSRQTLEADEFSLFYSTDFPTGGVQLVDENNDERIDDPLSSDQFELDYRLETRTWSDLTAGGLKNTQLQSPWNFDLSDGGFSSGISALTDFDAIGTPLSQWGEDLNFNGLQDGLCSSGACVANGVRCIVDGQCAGAGGGLCVLTPLGWCGGVVGGTQCTAFDDPADADSIAEDCEGNVNGLSCDLVECTDAPSCATANSMLINPVGGPIACYAAYEDLDPVNRLLDQKWDTAGGCGWQSAAPGSCSVSGDACYVEADCPGGESCDNGQPQSTGGIWHTGRISNTVSDCDVVANLPGLCSNYKVLTSGTGELTWWELLLSPEIEKVNGPDYELDIIDWGWNAAIDISGEGTALTWAMDLDLSQNEMVQSSKGNVLYWLDRTSPLEGIQSSLGGYPMFAPIGFTFDDQNGVVGNNRIGANACYFSADGAIQQPQFDKFLLASPADDDFANGRCPGAIPLSCTARCEGGGSDGHRCNDVVGDSDCPAGDCRVDSANAASNDCDVTDSCVSTSCLLSGASCVVDADCYRCQIDDAVVDEFVAANGPIRNMSLRRITPIDGRELTVGDVVGPAGDRFQAAVGIHSIDSAGTIPAYGLGLDDMVIEWREYTDVPDATLCSGGACATISSPASRLVGSSGVVPIRVVDLTPSANDCNDDGDRIDPGDDTDCDDDGTPDVRVSATIQYDSEARWFSVPEVATGIYELDLPYSHLIDVEGLFYLPGANLETNVTFRYFDFDDGTGQPCAASQGEGLGARPIEIQFANSSPGGRALVVLGVGLRDNGDDDGWADSNETVEMRLKLRNLSTETLTGVSVFAFSDDPRIDCVLDPVSSFPDLPPGGEAIATAPARFRVADVDRTLSGLSVADPFNATIQLNASADQFEILALEPVDLELDLDVSVAGGGPTTFVESFEMGFGTFDDLQNIDAGKNDLIGSDGYRCQYHDPDVPGSNSYGTINDCYLGASPAQADAYHWGLNGVGASDGGRAYDGVQSLHFGIDIGASLGYTTPTAALEAIATSQPVNLGWDQVCSESRLISCQQESDCPPSESCEFVSPTLSMKHQVSVVDFRTVGTTKSADAAVVQLRAVDAGGVPIGDWVKIDPVINGYDTVREDNYNSCMFDPIDDGSDEDDLFDPMDPTPYHGPSSTCAPEPVFAYQGDTDAPFELGAERIGKAPNGPALEGSSGAGSWIESTFDLSGYRGRRLLIRFLYTSLKVGGAPDYESIFGHNPDSGDDGWWIDDVQLTDTLTTPAVLVADTKDNSGLPACGGCQIGLDALVQSPPSPAASPGQPVTWSAAISASTVCPDGVPLYRYWVDGDGNGVGGDPSDRLLREFSADADFLAAPDASADYVVEVRCSSNPTCDATFAFSRQVSCPASSGSLFPTISAPSADLLGWGAPLPSFFARGDLAAVSTLTPSTSGALGSTGSLDISLDLPAAGGGYWYLLREDVAAGAFCNGSGSWSSGGSGEVPGRGGSLP